MLLYIDAAVSPGGTGLLYSASSARLSFALARNHYIPRQFGYLSERGVPVVSIIFGFLIGCLMFLPFPGWQVLVGFIVSAAVMGYAMVPLAFGAMRRQEPDHPRPFKLPAGEVLAPIAFIVANLVIYWTGWDILVVAAFSLAIYFYAISVRLSPEEVRSHVADARDEAEEEEELAV